MVKRGIGKNKISIIPNWVDTELVAPSDKMNDIRKIYMLRNKFVVTYAGTIGKAQNLEAIIESAEMLKEKRILFF